MRKNLLIILLFCCLTSILITGCSKKQMDEEKNINKKVEKKVENQISENMKKAIDFKLNEDIKFNNYGIKINAVELVNKGEDYWESSNKTSNVKSIRFDISLKNNTDEEMFIQQKSNFMLEDETGKGFAPKSGHYQNRKEFKDDIKKKSIFRGDVIFEIPENTSKAVLLIQPIYSDNINEGLALKVDLSNIKVAVDKPKESTADTKIDTSTSDKGDTVDKNEKHSYFTNFELLDHSAKRDEFGIGYITGTIKNQSNEKYSYVQVEINLNDSNGNVVGSILDNINNLEPGATWNFKATIIDDTNVKTYKIMNIEGY